MPNLEIGIVLGKSLEDLKTIHTAKALEWISIRLI